MSAMLHLGLDESVFLFLGVFLVCVSYGVGVRRGRSAFSHSENLWFRPMVECAGEGVLLLDDSANILYANRRIAEIFDIDVSGMAGRSIFGFVDTQGRGAVEVFFKQVRLCGEERGELCLRKSTGDTVWVLVASRVLDGLGGGARGVLWIVTEITGRKQRERMVCHLTQRDALTGLPNRSLLQDRIMQDIGRAYRYDTHVAILFLDLDRFKPVNDTFGHAVGDKILQEVAQRLVSRVRRMDTVARYGGDEFVVVLSDLVSKEEALSVALTLVELLKEPFRVGGQECCIGGSIGLALFPEDGQSGAELLEKADAAMYAAKQEGGGCCRRYAPG